MILINHSFIKIKRVWSLPLFLFSLLILSVSTQAQIKGFLPPGECTATLTGAQSVDNSSKYTYVLSGAETSLSWDCSGCTPVAGGKKGDMSAQVIWDGSNLVNNQYSITVLTGTKQFITLNVNVSGGGNCNFSPLVPTVQQDQACGATEIGITGGDPLLSYYWQSSSSGESTAWPADNHTVNSATTLYLKAQNGSGCWSDVLDVVSVTVKDVPSRPINPVLINDCGSYYLQLNNSNTNDYSFYWQTSSLGTDTQNSAAKYNPSQSGTYYVRAKHNNGCWSIASIGVLYNPDTQLDQVPTALEDINIPDVNSVDRLDAHLNIPYGEDATLYNSGNYVRAYTTFKESVTNYNQLESLLNNEVSVTTSYVDGLGRPVQNISHAVTAQENDLVAFQKYDDYGRVVKEYLPYAASGTTGSFRYNAPADQHSFYANSSTINEDIAKTGWAFSQTDYETSPLDKPLAKAAPGESWVGDGRKVTTLQRLNTASEIIPILSVDDNNNLVYSRDFDAGTLIVDELTDEQGNTTISYTDKLGNVILSESQIDNQNKAQTISVFNALNQLRMVIPPEAVDIISSNWQITTDAENLVFRYRYDAKGRMIAKKIPGQDGEIYTVYDKLGRAVLTQEAKQRVNNQWTYHQYDILGRPVASGICTIQDTDKSFQDLLAEMSNTAFYAVFDEAVMDYDWSNTFPATESFINNVQLLKITYYDNYNSLISGDYDFDNTAFSEEHFNAQNNRISGLITISKVKILDETNTWLKTVTHYDQKGRAIQVIGDNHLGGKDIISTLYDDFNSRVLKTKLQHYALGKTTEILKWYEHDHIGRVLKAYYQIDNQASELLAELKYNELGEMVSKKIGDNLQKIDHTYNVRGWLTSINGLDLNSDEQGSPADLWGMELSYDYGFSKSQFNGNIAGAKWVSSSDNQVHAYGYQYDQLNRLKQADYRQQEGDNWVITNGDFTVFDIDYDKNGNILKLNRQGGIDRDHNGDWQFGAMDRLNYHYDGNKLTGVDDKAFTEGIAADFKDFDQKFCDDTIDEYLYDENGNLKKDDNKGIQNIVYNHLNLPVLVDFGNGKKIEYLYDAAAIKLKKTVTDENGEVTVTYYSGEFVYQNDKIELIHTSEGKVVPEKVNGEMVENGVYDFEYILKDHLGNTRLITSDKFVKSEATMEAANLENEKKYFGNVEETQIISSTLSLNNSGAASLLPGTNGAPTVGPIRTFNVKKGDLIEASVWALYFEDASNQNYTYGSSNVNNPIEGQPNVTGGVIGTSTSGGGTPNAYLKLVFTPDVGGVSPEFVHNIANGSGAYQEITSSLEITENGELSIFLANESQADVIFDDFLIKHQQKIVQENSYYAFGMAIKPLDKEGDHKFTYNGKEFQSEIGWSDYGARMYDGQIGRWNSVDPLAEKYYKTSPYVYVLNNPMKFIDPDGKRVKWASYRKVKKNERLKGKFSSKKEFKQYKKELKAEYKKLLGLSSTAGELFRKLQEDKTKHVIFAGKDIESKSSPNEKGSNIYINLDSEYTPGVHNRSDKIMISLAHEAGHSWREMKGFDPPPLEANSSGIPWVAIAKRKEKMERGASHIENIVRGELIQSGRKNLEIRSSYEGMGIKVDITSDGKFIRMPDTVIFNLLDGGQYTKKGYLNGEYKFSDIKE